MVSFLVVSYWGQLNLLQFLRIYICFSLHSWKINQYFPPLFIFYFLLFFRTQGQLYNLLFRSKVVLLLCLYHFRLYVLVEHLDILIFLLLFVGGNLICMMQIYHLLLPNLWFWEFDWSKFMSTQGVYI